MSYSYLPIGATGFLYEDIAAPVSNKVFFAGEVNSSMSTSESVWLKLLFRNCEKIEAVCLVFT